MKHLLLSLQSQSEQHDNRHAQQVMKDLGITYRYAVPQSLGDCWWFLDCQGVPEALPSFITEMVDFKPHAAVGYGLTPEMANTLDPSQHTPVTKHPAPPPMGDLINQPYNDPNIGEWKPRAVDNG